MRRLVFAAAVSLCGAGCTSSISLVVAEQAGSPDHDGVPTTGDAAGEPAPASTTTTTTTTTLPPEPLTLGFAGDVQMIGSMAERRPLDAVAELLSAPDLMFVNLETVVGEAGEVGSPPIDKQFVFLSPPETLDQLAEAGVDVVGLANNHTWDHGPTGAAVTRARVDSSPLAGTGAGIDAAAAYAPDYVDVGGRTVGVVSLTRVPCDWSREAAAARPEVAYGCDRFAIAAVGSVATAAQASDLTVVLLHAGVEVSDCPGDRLREVVGVWIDAGADVVAISHPHVLQGVEFVDGAAVLWSTGNFAFQNGGGRTARSAVIEVTVGQEVEQIRLTPTVLPGGVAAPADPDAAALVRDEVSDRSVGGRIDSDGVLVADDTPSICD